MKHLASYCSKSKSFSKTAMMNNPRTRVEFKGSCLKQDKVAFTPKNVVNSFTFYELDTWSRDLNADFILKDCFFGAVKLIANPDADKYSYSGYGIRFDSRSLFSLLIVVGVKMLLFWSRKQLISAY